MTTARSSYLWSVVCAWALTIAVGFVVDIGLFNLLRATVLAPAPKLPPRARRTSSATLRSDEIFK